MTRNWDEFVQEYADQQYKNALFNLRCFVEHDIESPIERVMYVVLRDEFESSIQSKVEKMERQKQIGKYRVDFYLSYMTDTGLAEFIIECDGHDFHERTKAQARHDKQRDRFFTQNGYIVLRYTGSEIFKDYKELTKPIWTIIVAKDQVI